MRFRYGGQVMALSAFQRGHFGEQPGGRLTVGKRGGGRERSDGPIHGTDDGPAAQGDHADEKKEEMKRQRVSCHLGELGLIHANNT